MRQNAFAGPGTGPPRAGQRAPVIQRPPTQGVIIVLTVMADHCG